MVFEPPTPQTSSPAYQLPQPAHPPAYGPPPARPQPKPNWLLIGGIVGGVTLLLAGLVVVGLIADRAERANIEIAVTSCTIEGDGILPSATVGYTVTNKGSSSKDVTLAIEYRDSSGARVDTDTAYVRNVPPGDTVRGEETTLLNASVTSVRCGVKVR